MPSEEHQEVFQATDGWRWRHVAGNGEITATGEAHQRKHDAIRAARADQPDLPIRIANADGSWEYYSSGVRPDWDNEPENQPDGWSFSDDEPDRDPGM